MSDPRPVFELGRPPAAERPGAARRPARLSQLRHARSPPLERGAVPDVLRGAAHRHRLAGPAGRHPRSRALVHRHPQHVRQWPVHLAQQPAPIGRPSSTSPTTTTCRAGSAAARACSASRSWRWSTAGRWARSRPITGLSLTRERVRAGGRPVRHRRGPPSTTSVFLRSLEARAAGGSRVERRALRGAPVRGIRAFACIYASWAACQASTARASTASWATGISRTTWRGPGRPSYRRRASPGSAGHAAHLDGLRRVDQRHGATRGRPEPGTGARSRRRTLVMPSATDLYFTPEDCAADAAAIPGARLLAIPSIWGHRAETPTRTPTTRSSSAGPCRS